MKDIAYGHVIEFFFIVGIFRVSEKLVAHFLEAEKVAFPPVVDKSFNVGKAECSALKEDLALHPLFVYKNRFLDEINLFFF